jgi:hypothetical protein
MVKGRIIKVKLNKSQFRKTVADGLTSTEIKNAAYVQAVTMTESVKRRTIQEFENHPVTQEISAGPEASNKSGTLSSGGNLYSFIGFNQGGDPTDVVRSYLNDKIKVFRQSRFVKSQMSGHYTFRVNPPMTKEIENLTPLPWESGRSWVRGIERGISGLGYFLYGRYSQSRSGTGIQSAHEIRPAIFRTKRYLTSIIANFYTNIRNKKF